VIDMVLRFMRDLAEGAGEICLHESDSMNEERVEYKSVRDLVTPVDIKVEDYLREQIMKRFPGHGIFGEERGTTLTGSDSCWVLDPIDGTTSYVHGLPGYSVSIALQRAGETVAGVVYAPVLGQMFTAEKGAGAHMNGKKIQVSGRADLLHSLLTTGFSCIRDGQDNDNLKAFNRIMLRVRDIRRHGSAALDLAWVAAGKLDGYWEQSLKLYDIAAGTLLVTEAGGQVSDYGGGANFPQNGLVATNGLIGEELLSLLADE
jgi:myo-inositol-1(or 4)-monophosphatase